MPKSATQDPGPGSALELVEALTRDDDIDSDDLEVLSEAIDRHLSQTAVVEFSTPNAAGTERLTALVCPFYASASLAQHVQLLEVLQQQGLRVLAQAIGTASGQVLVRLSEGSADAVGRVDDGPECLLSAWSHRQVTPGTLAANSVTRLSEMGKLLPTADDLTAACLEALKPALYFGLRALPARRQKSVMSAIEKWITPRIRARSEQAADAIGRAAASAADEELMDAARASAAPLMGLYNFLAAPPPAGADPGVVRRYRLQALQAMPNLAPVMGDFHTGEPGAERLRLAIDGGEKIGDVLERMLGVRGNALKAFHRADLSMIGGRASIDLYWVREYCAVLQQIHPQRSPKSAEEYAATHELRLAMPAVERMAMRLGVTPHALWDGVLNKGWKAGLGVLASHAVDPVPEALAEAAVYAVDTLNELDDMVDRLHAAVEAAAPGHDALAVTRAMLTGRGALRLTELLHGWRNLRAQIEAIEMPPVEGLPPGYDWSPMLRERSVTVNGFTIRELVNADELEVESAVMTHCVRGYGNACKHFGKRIFRIERGSAVSTGSRATLCLIISSDGASFRVEQLRGPRNKNVGEGLAEAVNSFIRSLHSGEVACDFNGPARDARMTAQREDAEARRQALLKERARVLDEGAALFMPKTCRDMSLSQFIESSWLSDQLRASDANAQGEMQAADMPGWA